MAKKQPMRRLVKKKRQVKRLAKKKLTAKQRLQKRLSTKKRASKQLHKPARVLKKRASKRLAKPARVLKKRASKRLVTKKMRAAKLRKSSTKTSRAANKHSMSFAELQELSISTNKTLDNTNKTLDNTNKTLDNTNKILDNTNKTLDNTNKTLDNTNKTLDRVGVRLDKTGEDLDKQRDNIDKLSKSIQQLRGTVGAHDSKWGELSEALIIGDAQRTFNDECGFKLHTTSPRVKITCADGATIREIDGIVHGETEVVVIEAKTNLTVQDVRNFINNVLVCFTDLQRQHHGKKIHGAVGYLHASHQAITFAHKNGMFVIRSRHDVKEIITPPRGFKPRDFHP